MNKARHLNVLGGVALAAVLSAGLGSTANALPVAARVAGGVVVKAGACVGATAVTFAPNPVNIPIGGTARVTATVTNKPVNNFLLNGTAKARLIDADVL